MLVLALHPGSGPSPQTTDAPRARGEEFWANGSMRGQRFLLLPGRSRGGTMAKLNQLIARLRATLKL